MFNVTCALVTCTYPYYIDLQRFYGFRTVWVLQLHNSTSPYFFTHTLWLCSLVAGPSNISLTYPGIYGKLPNFKLFDNAHVSYRSEASWKIFKASRLFDFKSFSKHYSLYTTLVGPPGIVDLSYSSIPYRQAGPDSKTSCYEQETREVLTRRLLAPL